MAVGYLRDLVSVWAAAVGFRKGPTISCFRIKSERRMSAHFLSVSAQAVVFTIVLL